MNEPRPPDPTPLRTNDTATILAGTGLWVVALIVLLIIGPPPERHWWIWTCVAGIGMGAFGCLYVWRRDRRAPDATSVEPHGGSPATPDHDLDAPRQATQGS